MIEVQYCARGHNDGAGQHKGNCRRDDRVGAVVLMIGISARTRLPDDDVRGKE